MTHVETMYKPNPYHNNIHAADVTQTAGVIMKALDMHLRSNSSVGSNSNCSGCNCCPSCCCVNNKAALPVSNGGAVPGQAAQSNNSSSVEPGLSKLERFAVIFASAVHDLSHPGVNNMFLIKTRDKQAMVYNDRSVNENMHASLAFNLALEHKDLNLFSKFSTAEYEQVRRCHQTTLSMAAVYCDGKLSP